MSAEALQVPPAPTASTVDHAWLLLRRAWHAKRAGNEAWKQQEAPQARRPVQWAMHLEARNDLKHFDEKHKEETPRV